MAPRLLSGGGLARAAAVAVVAVAAVGLPGTALAQEDPHEPGHGDGLVPPGEWTHEEIEILLDLVDRTEAELPAFADPADLPEGFYDFGVTAPGGYDHYINWEWLDDEHILDPEHPESLVYQRTWNDETQQQETTLVSAMFFLPTQYDATNIPADLAWYPGWHTHADVCINERHRFGGVDIGGLHCDVHGGHMPEDPEDPHEPHEPEEPHNPEEPHEPHNPEAPHNPQHPEAPHDPQAPHDPGHDMGDDGHHNHVPPAATPTHRHPDTAG